MVNVDRYGNTSSASIPLALDQAVGRGPGQARVAGAAGRVRRRVHLGERRRPVVTVLMCPGQGAQRVGHGQGPRRALSRGARDLRRHRRGARRRRSPGSCGRARRTSSPSPTTPSPPSSPTPPRCSRSSPSGSARVAAGAGHSLGEYSAHVAARTLTVADAARLVRRRGELMLEAGQARPGAMAAVLGLATAEVEAACNEASGDRRRGGGGQPQRARPDRDLRRSRRRSPRPARAARRAGAKRVVPLKVSGAFHSPLMAAAVDGLREALAAATFADPAVPGDRQRERRSRCAPASTPSGCWPTSSPRRYAGWSACRPPRRWRRTRRSSRSGPGNVLSGLLKRIVPGASDGDAGHGGRGGEVPRA